MRLNELSILHHKIVHELKGRCAHTNPKPRVCNWCKEALWVGRYQYSALNEVCEECFGDPSRFLQPSDLLELQESDLVRLMPRVQTTEKRSEINPKQVTRIEMAKEAIKHTVYELNSSVENPYFKLTGRKTEFGSVWQPWYQDKKEVLARGLYFVD